MPDPPDSLFISGNRDLSFSGYVTMESINPVLLMLPADLVNYKNILLLNI
jgi:hypothetical protein